MKIKPSLVLLTWNRKPSVEKSLTANLKSAHFPLYEIIHVDNGSEPGFCDWFADTFKPTVQVRHSNNRGVAVGYNRGLALATGSHVIITGCDRVMPDRWLLKWAEALEKIPQTAVISCYTEHNTKRYHQEHGQYSEPEERNGVYIQRSIPVEARIHSKDFLFKTGFFREDFGTYGYEDAEWSDRACRTAAKEGLICYHLPKIGIAKQLSDVDFPHETIGKNYTKFKKEIHEDPRRRALFSWCHRNGSPHYNPYSRIEPDKLKEM